MSRKLNKPGRNIRRAASALPLVVLAAAIHAEPAMQGNQATPEIAPAASGKIVEFSVFPAGSSTAGAVVNLLQGAVSDLGNSPTTLVEVDQWSDSLTNALRQGGFPVGQVLVTEPDWQAAQQGQPLVFTAFPGRIHGILIDNKSRVKDGRLQKLLGKALCEDEAIGSGCLLRTERLERATQLLQDVPGVAIGAAPRFSPGTGTGDVDVLFTVEQRGKPLTADVFIDNKGIESTGLYQLGMSGSANNYFGLGENYALSLAVTDKKMWTGSLTGGIPVFHDGLRLTGGLTRQQYVINSFGRLAGVANTAQMGLLYPVTRGLDSNVWVGGSYLHSRTSTDLFHGLANTHSTLNSLRFSLQANNGDRAQQLRTNIWSGELALTVGKRGSNETAYDVTERDGNYAKVTGTAFGTYGLNSSGDMFLSGQANAQLASRNLDASEKLSVGGPNAVRAYRADEGSVDDGAVLNLGLYKRIPVATGHQAQFGIFSDFAIGRVNHNPWPDWESSYVGIPNISNRRILAGYGLSLDWLTPIGATISASVSKAYGFSSTSWVDPGKKPLQYWLSVTWSK